MAPGEDIYSTLFYKKNNALFENYYGGGWSGTSLAVPLVSGTAATMKALRPNLSLAEIKGYLLSNTKDIYSYNPGLIGKLGSGLLDFNKVIQAILSKPAPKPSFGPQNNYLMAALGTGSFPQIKILQADGSSFKSFFAFSTNFKGEIFAVGGDVNGDGQSEVVTAAGVGGGPQIRIFNINGQLLSQFFAFDKNLRNGLSLAAGDINGDGKDEILVGAGKGQKPEIKIFDYKGKLLLSFMAFENNFRGGVRIAAGDVSRDGKAEIIAGKGFGGAPLVKIFNGEGKALTQFFAYNSLMKSGVNVACGDFHGDGQPEVITTLGKGNQPEIKIFTYRGDQLANFYVQEPGYLLGLNISAGDINNDGLDEILAGKSVGANAQIRAFSLQGNLIREVNAYNQNYKGGVRPGFIRY
jgi:hypothetical protein